MHPSNSNNRPLMGNSFSYSQRQIHDQISEIAKIYDVTHITEQQKHAMSKALFDQGIISAIEHAILSLPSRSIKRSLMQQEPAKETLNLIDIYQKKVNISRNYSNLSAEKAIDEKFLFIMQDLHQQHIH